MFGLAVSKFLAGLSHQEEFAAPCAQELAEPLFRAAIGRRRVERSDAAFERHVEQRLDLTVAGQRKAVAARIADIAVAPEFDRAEAERARSPARTITPRS